METCKQCLLLESSEEAVLKDIQEKINKLSPEEKADEALYAQRLRRCKTCSHLISGMCMKCGCYVEFRAAFARQKCPNPSDRKW